MQICACRSRWHCLRVAQWQLHGPLGVGDRCSQKTPAVDCLSVALLIPSLLQHGVRKQLALLLRQLATLNDQYVHKLSYKVTQHMPVAKCAPHWLRAFAARAVRPVAAQTAMQTVKLPHGEMPVIGLGVYKAQAGSEAHDAVKSALQLGYTHIDTAQASLKRCEEWRTHVGKKCQCSAGLQERG